jgi:hypothetical protein
MNIISIEMDAYFIAYYNFIELEESHLQTKVNIITRSKCDSRIFFFQIRNFKCHFTKFSFLKT